VVGWASLTQDGSNESQQQSRSGLIDSQGHYRCKECGLAFLDKGHYGTFHFPRSFELLIIVSSFCSGVQYGGGFHPGFLDLLGPMQRRENYYHCLYFPHLLLCAKLRPDVGRAPVGILSGPVSRLD
jgi:hypothetical protein